jgi:hypothetical protein
MNSKSGFRRITDNPVTRNPRIQGPGKLISINMVPFALENEKKGTAEETLAHVVTVMVKNDAGISETKTGICFKTNLDRYGHLPFGTEVLVTQEKTPGYDTLLTTVDPHLAAGTRSLAVDFSDAFAGPVSVPTPSEVRNAQRAGAPLTVDGKPWQEAQARKGAETGQEIMVNQGEGNS